MGIKHVDELPKCDFCNCGAKYDAPTKVGSWANMCSNCAKTHTDRSRISIGTQFALRDQTQKGKGAGKASIGIEDTDFGNLDSDREIRCPICNEVRTVEPDADYKYDCDGCGAKVKVPSIL
jgi:hypothetical protein